MKSRQKLKSLLAACVAIAMLGCCENFALAAATDDATAGISGAAVAPAPPRLDFVFESHVNLGEFKLYGTYNAHKRGVMHLLGGTFEGPGIRGKILPSDRDWPTYYGNGVRSTDVQYVYVTDDGVPLFVTVDGYRYDKKEMTGPMLEAENVKPAPNMLRIFVRIHAPDDSRYSWMNYNLFVGVAGKSGAEREATLRVYRLL
ncbi:uncharacterized protein DUF3237 [Paraburkholderia sp. BL27I4N3]|uniref:DUF3237 family protein n=1 Tax=Paraburkholderia sp. BL27I4N3 TaxID=1938805 RepID=UPI000E21CD53|nr:DUF3237 domain-containing protein [Paraburkholderia sp. BL27I4N3]REE07375.1 uncharacterized protein DUF3237 [Paraburkholderia sp. BL27I4N3]